MFAFNSSRPRSHSQSITPTYLSGNIPLETPISSSSHPRLYSSDLCKDMLDQSPDTYATSRQILYYDAGSSSGHRQSFDRQQDLASSGPPVFSYRSLSDNSSRPPLSSAIQTKPNELPFAAASLSPQSSSGSQVLDTGISASSVAAVDSEIWASTSFAVQERALDLPKPKKHRREKPRIELAPDQPPTTQGKPRARVYVACLQCRTRKIRCDGAKPVCHNCGRRTGGNECTYDTVPKRRGPDKTPGARQRMARDVKNQIDCSLFPRRRRRTRDIISSEQVDMARETSTSLSPIIQCPDVGVALPVLAPITPTIGTGGSDPYNTRSSVASYSRSTSFSECGCHRLSPCPGPLRTSSTSDGRRATSLLSSYGDAFDLSGIMFYGDHTSSTRAYLTELDENENERNDSCPDIVSQPSLSFTRKIWWGSLLSLYSSPNSTRLQSLTPSQRETAAQGIASDLRFVFRASNYWFSFFHIPSFFGSFFDPVRRERMQPSLVLALLAMSTFWQSSEVGIGMVGRERALRFRDEAQGALEASFNTGWIDETLAQAAWLLALFEVCAHPHHSSERCVSALVMLDSVIRSLSLTFVDADDPNTTMFLPGTVPVVPVKNQPKTSWFDDPPLNSCRQITEKTEATFTSSLPHASPEVGCSCNSITLCEHWPSTNEHAPLWGRTPAWNDSWSEAEIRKESCRRLCWSAMVVAAGHISYTTAHRSHNPDLFIADPANYALLFSGESVARSPALSTSSKDTIWALQDRCFLLWHACIRMRSDQTASDMDKAQFATKIWLEADALEAALNRHTCSIERAFIFQAREYIFNTRMSISYEFQRFIPLATANVSGMFHRNKAEEWLRHQATVAERFMFGLHTITGNSNNLLARRPFFVFWFMGQISRSLSLWQCDNTLTVALDVCKALLPAIDYLSALWPCPEQRHRYEILRERLNAACYAAGVSLPAPPNLTLPSPTSPEALV